jgi:hypothetical protein
MRSPLRTAAAMDVLQKILLQDNTNRDPRRICEELTHLFENLYLETELKYYYRYNGLSFDGSEAALLIEEARQAGARAVASQTS